MNAQKSECIYEKVLKLNIYSSTVLDQQFNVKIIISITYNIIILLNICH